MKPDNKMLASLIADSLFENNLRQYADRLVLTTRSGKDLGGWCKSAAASEIERVLNQWNTTKECRVEVGEDL